MFSGGNGVGGVLPYRPGQYIELIGVRVLLLPQMTRLGYRQIAIVKQSSAQSVIVKPPVSDKAQGASGKLRSEKLLDQCCAVTQFRFIGRG